MNSLFLKYKTKGKQKIVELGKPTGSNLPLTVTFESDQDPRNCFMIPKEAIREDFLASLIEEE